MTPVNIVENVEARSAQTLPSLNHQVGKDQTMHINDILDYEDLQAIIERFETFYVKQPNGCWEWQRSFAYNGYGLFTIRHKSFRAHRLACIFYKRRLPKRKQVVVRHKCDNPRCVNPSHLVPGTLLQNARDRYTHGNPWGRGEENPGAKLTTEQVKAIRLDVRHARVVAADYKVSRGTIDNIRSGKRWRVVKSEQTLLPKFPSGNRGEQNVQAKLTSDEVRAIRTDARKYPEIAAIYGLNRASVSNIKRHVTWKHLE